ncbi:hypothetical protein ABE85_13640 [Mitsuaria sp. 7]|nr:hypothetical protein ABE85_13640 [Mitsuaria sp. 7]
MPAAVDAGVVVSPGPPAALGLAVTDPVAPVDGPVDVPVVLASVGTTGPPVVSLEETMVGAAS